MARFLHGLNREVQDIVQFYYYTSLDDLPLRGPTLVVLVRRVRKKRTKCQERTTILRRRVSLHMAEKRKLPHLILVLLSLVALSEKGKLPPNAQIEEQWLIEYGNMESESAHENSFSSSEVESSSDSSYRKGDLLMVRSLMSSLISEDSDSQRENIFHSSEKGEMIVDRQVSSDFTLGKTKGDPQTLSPREVCEDQLKMKNKREKEQNEKKKAKKAKRKESEKNKERSRIGVKKE
ncbi:hypothetical protein CR513_11514, partial [Mucuna pruriens]